MWKYFIIGAVVLFLFAVFVFSKNHEAMVAPNGEIAALQAQYSDAIAKNKNISLDRTIKAYSEMRTEWLMSEKNRYVDEKTDLDNQTSALKEESAELNVKFDQIGGEVERIQNQMKEVLEGIASIPEIGSSTEFDEVTAKVTALSEGNIELERLCALEDATIAALNKLSEDLNAQIAAARRLNMERQARISPAEMECSVIISDPSWEYVILDAGVDKGIVIGSRLAVMRGEQKICELNVTLVESNRSSCDIVYSTMLPGERVLVGDRVISVRQK